MRIGIERDIDNGIKANELLAALSEVLSAKSEMQIEVDFSKVKFIAANQLAVLGAMFNEYSYKNKLVIRLSGINEKLKKVMRKNGFGRYIGFEAQKDMFHTVIPFRLFAVEESIEFEQYLLVNIFQREDIPLMSSEAKNTIIDNFLEMFNNVKEHAGTNRIYASGQFFPKSKMLFFTIADIGKTIKENVQEHFREMSISMTEEYYIEWALKEGNTTRKENSPGGLGFSIISKFIELNQGIIMIRSGNEVYEFSKGKSRFLLGEHDFIGTIVTVAINVNDEFTYLASGDSIEQICF